jgi:hypothetical protein
MQTDSDGQNFVERSSIGWSLSLPNLKKFDGPM